MKKAAFYVRQSIFKDDSLSISMQIDRCLKELDRLNPGQAYEVYDDSDFSGKDTNRPRYQDMLNDIKNEKIDKIICYKLDRLNREPRDYLDISELCEKHKVSIVSISENFDTSTETGKFMSLMLVNFAKMERINTVTRVTDNYYTRASIGAFLGGPAPYGFSIDRMKNPISGKLMSYLRASDNAKYVKMMYQKYLAGNSLSQIAHDFNANNILSPCGQPWDSGKISRLLRNANYCKASPAVYNYFVKKGAKVYNDIELFRRTDHGLQLVGKRPAKDRKYTNVENHTLYLMQHKGIINADVWVEAQRKLDNNKQIRNTFKGKYSWLSGLVKCGRCGKSLIVKYAYNRKKEKDENYVYLVCSTQVNARACEGFNPPLRLKEIEPAMDQEILRYLSNFTNIKPVLDIPAEIREKESEIDANKAILNNYLQAIADGAKWDALEEKVEKLRAEQTKRYEELDKLYSENSNQHKQNIQAIIDEWESLSVEDKRNIAREFIAKVMIHEMSAGIDIRPEYIVKEETI